MAKSNFNPVKEMQYTSQGALPAPSPGPMPEPSPSPKPTPAPSPRPTASTQQGSYPSVNTFVRLAMSEVRPGDLITADFANNIIEALIALDSRLRDLEGYDRATASAPAATPTPTPTPPSRASGASASGIPPAENASERRANPGPTIQSVAAIAARKGVKIDVKGDNIGESEVERVLLGGAQVAPKSIAFNSDGFSVTTTAAAVEKAENQLTVVTKTGQHSAALNLGENKASPQ